jgi:hypothetical protein
VIAFVAVYLSVSSPSSLSIEPGTDVVAETLEIDYVINDPSPFSAKLPGKQPPPLNMPISPTLFSLVLALELPLLLYSYICCIV